MNMKKNILGRTGLEISVVTFGGIICNEQTQADSNDYVAHAIDCGVNYFDSAPSYGNSEEKLGVAIEQYRKNIYLACKTNKRDAATSKQELLDSLKALKTDYFDVYQLHVLSRFDEVDKVFADDGAIETMMWAKREGLIRNIGFSAHNEAVALKMLDLFDFDTVLYPLNWAMSINIGWGNKIAARAKAENKGLVAIKTLSHRQFRDKEEHPQFPRAWLKTIDDDKALGIAGMKYGLSLGADTLVPPGNYYHLEFMLDNIDEVLAAPLTDDERALLNREAALVKDEMIFQGNI